MKFKYKFSTTVFIIFILMYVLAVVCFVWNLIRLINSLSSNVVPDVYSVISTVMCLVLPIVLTVFVTAMILSSYYIIGEKTLRVKFGFISDKYPISDMKGIIKNVKTDELSIIFKDESALKVVLDKTQFDDFSSELMKKDKNLNYGETDEASKK